MADSNKIDPKSIAPGSMVTARGRFKAVHDHGCVSVVFDDLTFLIPATALVFVEPPLKVGDRVRIGRFPELITILAIHEDQAWIMSARGNRYTWPLADLTRIEDTGHAR